MAVMDVAGVLGLSIRVNAEQDRNCLLPVRAVGGRIEQTHIELDVRPIVVSEISARRGCIVERLGHS